MTADDSDDTISGTTSVSVVTGTPIVVTPAAPVVNPVYAFSDALSGLLCFLSGLLLGFSLQGGLGLTEDPDGPLGGDERFVVARHHQAGALGKSLKHTPKDPTLGR